jgi:hypothetical protein
MAPRLSIQPRSWLVPLLAGGLAHAQESPVLGLQDQIEQDGRAFLLKATCRF